MTWQIAICIMLIALLAWALRPYYKMGHFRPRKGDLLRRGSVLIAGLLCLIPIAHPQILGMFGVETDVWDQLGAYQTGGAAAAAETPNLWKWKNRMIPRRNASTLL